MGASPHALHPGACVPVVGSSWARGVPLAPSPAASGFGAGRGQWVSFNTPDFRRWHQAIADWLAEPADQRDPLPPLSLHDLEDTHLFTPGDLAEGVYLTANVWLGSAETRV